MRWLENITDSMDMNVSQLLETVKDRGAWHGVVRHDLATEQQQPKSQNIKQNILTICNCTVQWH